MIQLLLLIISLLTLSAKPLMTPVAPKPLAVREFSLEKRYAVKSVNDVFRDNILLTIDYLSGGKIDPKNIDWNKVTKPSEYKITLKPGETFAFHDDVLPQYKGKITKTSNAHFNSQEGFKSDGYLVGDGVCHLASIIYWTAKSAGLEAYAPVRHDFAPVPEIPREYGVSIYATPGANAGDEQQNLYITNNKSSEIAFVFDYDGHELKVSVESI